MLHRKISGSLESVPLDRHIEMFDHINMRKSYSKAIPDNWRTVARVFIALGDEHRQRILLAFEPGERANVSQIAEVSTLSRPAVSHHLKILREAGVLDSRKEGKEVFYWINRAFLLGSLQSVLDHVRDET